MASSKHWLIAPPAPLGHLCQYRDMSAVLAQILHNRGFTDPEAAYHFLHAHDPTIGSWVSYRRKPAIDRAIGRIRAAIRKREWIAIYGDFDADGVTSTALLVLTLQAMGANVRPYIPHRVDEGYGLNAEALTKLAAEGVRLVITVDCGIRAAQEIDAGTRTGLDIIVTDHHEPGGEVTPGYAVINPKLTDIAYTEPMLAGVGVAFRLAQALLFVAKQNREAVNLSEDDLLDLVAIGTVADLAPLDRPENRALVRRGLTLLNTQPRVGMKALLNASRKDSALLDSYDIGYIIGPRLNAAGRLASAMKAYDLLMSADTAYAQALAEELNSLNAERQELTRSAQTLIRDRVNALDLTDLPLIFAGDSSFKPGIVGLVAGRLSEEFFRPAVIMEEGDAESRASCRSIPQFDITHALDQCADLLVRHGGHAQAAGFTVLNDNIPALKDRLMELARVSLAGQELRPTLEIDVEIDAAQITLGLAEELQSLEPTGNHNPTPTLMTRGLRVVDVRIIGKEQNHLKLRLARPDGSVVDAVGFHMAELRESLTTHIDAAYELSINQWNGTRSAQLKLRDLRPTDGAA